MTSQPISVECPDCQHIVGIVTRPESVWAALNNHTCTTTRGNIMSSQPLHAVPAPGKRPHPRDLVAHDDPKISRAAKKVLDAIAVLDAAWKDNAAKSELRARQAQLETELAQVKAQIRGVKPAAAVDVKPDWKAVRAWAADQGMDCPATGKIPNRIVDAYTQAHG